MARARLFRLPLPLFLGIALLCSFRVLAKPAFLSSEIEGESSDIFFCDLDGDRLQDAVLVDETNLSVFFQEPGKGFTRSPQLKFPLDGQPAILWPAKLGGQTSSLLLMTSNGVAELDFTNRTDPPSRRQIIEQPTIVPVDVVEDPLLRLTLSANTGTDWPLLLLPVGDSLQVWQHRDTWQQAQVIEHALSAPVTPSVRNPGYSQSFTLNLCVSDVNGDGRDDLMVMRRLPGGTQVYTLYLQGTNGLFDLTPALIYTNPPDWRTVLAWMDINRDGKLDLIKSTISDELSFVPGLQSGKVLVAAYFADQHGQIPAAPQQVFRKNDWSGFLPMVDVDGDGFMDLVLGNVPIDSRDGLRSVITEGKLNLNLKFHFYRPGQGFAPEPDFQRDLPIYFDHALMWNSEDRIYSEKFLSLNGDFNGDGKKDLLVRDHSSEISVYFFNSRATGFSAHADLTFPCPELMDWWRVADLNGDGVSDLVVKLKDRDVYRIFLSEGK